jgi:hypothetical protein
MGFFSYLFDRWLVLFLVGAASMVFGALCALFGEAPLRYHGWAYRDENPKRFWRRVLGYLLFGFSLISISLVVAFIGSHFYKMQI